MTKSLRSQAVSGLKWVSAAQVFNNVLRIISTIILARLLSPDDFGLMGMAVVVTSFLSIFGNLGFSAAVIQRQTLTHNALSSIYWLNVSLGIVLAGLVLLSAPFVADFYQESRIIPLLTTLGLAFILTSLGSLHRALFQKALLFSKISLIEMVASLIGILLGICAAVLGAGVWSLVINTLTISAVSTLLVILASSWRPAFVFVWADVRPMFNFSLSLTGFSIVNYFARSADDILVGRYLGAQALGHYGFAYNVMLYPLQNISQVISKVMFPVLSQIQDDHTRIRDLYVNASATIAMVTFPMMAGIAIVADPIIPIVLGVKWEPVALLLVILAPVGALQSIGTLVGQIYLAKGRTDIMLYWGLFAAVVVVGAFVIGLHWGIVGVAACYALASALLFLPSLWIAFRLIELPVTRVLVAMVRPAAASLLMLGILLLAKLWWPNAWSQIGLLATLIPTGILIYGALIYWLERDRVRELFNLVLNKS